MINHANCSHPATKADRAACRKAAAQVDTAALALLEVLNSANWVPSPNHWVFYAARRFASVETSDPVAAARSILDHFAPSGDEDRDASRLRNGYTITTDPYRIRSIILRAAS